jgi:hypothetical protein
MTFPSPFPRAILNLKKLKPYLSHVWMGLFFKPFSVDMHPFGPVHWFYMDTFKPMNECFRNFLFNWPHRPRRLWVHVRSVLEYHIKRYIHFIYYYYYYYYYVAMHTLCSPQERMCYKWLRKWTPLHVWNPTGCSIFSPNNTQDTHLGVVCPCLALCWIVSYFPFFNYLVCIGFDDNVFSKKSWKDS